MIRTTGGKHFGPPVGVWGCGGGGLEVGLGRSSQMVLLSGQLLAASVGVSPLTNIHQSRCVGPPFRSLDRQRVAAPTH